MEQDTLNKKLALWAGFEIDVDEGVFYYKSRIKYISPDGEWDTELPNFTNSLDACFQWLAPKDYQQILFQPDGYCCIIIDDKLYEGSGETLATSFCSAIERLIDGS